LVEKLHPLQLKTGEEFSEAAKRFTDAKLYANRRNWPDAVLCGGGDQSGGFYN
jgi:hypothetical protein